jgi:hypothetical protein
MCAHGSRTSGERKRFLGGRRMLAGADVLMNFIITAPQLMNNLEMPLPSGKPPPQNNQA